MDQSDLVSVAVERRGRPPVALVHVRGELDFNTTPVLVGAIAGLPEPGQCIILDLAKLTFCDSSGLGALIAAHKAAAAGGGRLYLADVTPSVLTAITVTSLDQLFALRPDVDTILAEIGSR